MQHKNWILHNIQNVKGKRKPPSFLQDQHKLSRSLSKKKLSPTSKVSPNRQPTLMNRVDNIQKTVSQLTLQKSRSQSIIIDQISEIKDDIRMIKSHLFQLGKKSLLTNQSSTNHYSNTYDQRHNTQQSVGQQENIYLSLGSKQRMGSQGSQYSFKQSKFAQKNYQSNHNKITLQQIIHANQKKLNNKKGVSIKSIYPMLKQYKLQGPQYGNIFYGYMKRNSQPVAIKYIQNTFQFNHIIQIYDKMWKNIAKARWPCINKLYDYKVQDNNFLIMQKNKANIIGLPWKSIIIDIFRALQFIHQCGYLYRNIQAEHFMLNQQGQLVIIDFKRTKRYVDIKGHILQVVDTYNGGNFVSNNQIRGHHEGRKDDLESLGYFALLLMNYDIPWFNLNKQQTIKIRSTLTLQQLFQGHKGWIQYMATVMRMNRNDRPDYRRLQQILQNL